MIVVSKTIMREFERKIKIQVKIYEDYNVQTYLEVKYVIVKL